MSVRRGMPIDIGGQMVIVDEVILAFNFLAATATTQCHESRLCEICNQFWDTHEIQELNS